MRSLSCSITRLFQEVELLVRPALLVESDDAFEHVAELVLVDLGAGLGDHVVDAAAALEAHPLAEQGAVAALGEAARADAERAVFRVLAVPRAR